MESWARSISAITLFVDDLEATKQFYASVFDSPLVFEDDVSAVFKIGETLVNLLAETEADQLIEPAGVAAADAGARMQLTIAVENVDATCAELRRRGVALLNGPIDRPWGVRTAAFRDPANHVWELAQPTPGR